MNNSYDDTTQQMTPMLPLGHELKAEWRPRVIHKRNYPVSMEMSFFTMPTQRQAGRPLQPVAIRQAHGPEQSRRTHGQRP